MYYYYFPSDFIEDSNIIGHHHGVTVVGGRYGLDLRQGQPSATVSRATLVNQSCAAVLYEGVEALTAVGVAVSGLRGCVAVRAGFPLALPPAGDACALPPMDNGGQQMPLGTVAGAVALIDARVAWADGANTCAERAVVAVASAGSSSGTVQLRLCSCAINVALARAARSRALVFRCCPR